MKGLPRSVVCCTLLLGIAYSLQHKELQLDGIDEYEQVEGPGGSRAAPGDGGRSITVRWTKCIRVVNICQVTYRNIIGRIEDNILKIPLQIISAITLIPLTIAKVAIALVEKLLTVVIKAKLMLEEFFRTIYEAQARAVYGTVSIIHDLVVKIQVWCRNCISSSGSNCQGLPHLGGFGPCCGQWPCITTCVCKTVHCISVTKQIAGRTSGQGAGGGFGNNGNIGQGGDPYANQGQASDQFNDPVMEPSTPAFSSDFFKR